MSKEMPSRPDCTAPSAGDPLADMQLALFRVLKSLVFRGDPNSPLNELPLSQLKCLHVITSEDGQKMQDLAHRMEIKLPAVSQIVDRLVRRGLVERRPDQHDRRVVRLGLTDKSRAMMKVEEDRRHARMAATGRNLTADAMEKVTEGLELLAVAAERVEAEERVESEDRGSRPDAMPADTLVELTSRRSRTRVQNAVMSVSPESASSRP